jgi:uncharacterized membrane protein YagU involved in acid resistance
MICLYTDKNCPYVDRENISMTKKCTKCENYGRKQKLSLYRSRVARFLLSIVFVIVTGFWFLISIIEGEFWGLVVFVLFAISIVSTFTQFRKLQNREYYVK